MAMGDKYDDITQNISFEDVRDNFGKAAKFGIDSEFTWFKDKKISAIDLVLKELLPMAREGLKKMEVKTVTEPRTHLVLDDEAKYKLICVLRHAILPNEEGLDDIDAELAGELLELLT